MPRITEADLKKQIKNKSFSPVYLIYGSEQMFVKSYTKSFVRLLQAKIRPILIIIHSAVTSIFRNLPHPCK